MMKKYLNVGEGLLDIALINVFVNLDTLKFYKSTELIVSFEYYR